MVPDLPRSPLAPGILHQVGKWTAFSTQARNTTISLTMGQTRVRQTNGQRLVRTFTVLVAPNIPVRGF